MTADFDRGRVDLAREADFQLGPILVRPATRQVESGGASETLEPRIMQVLVVLARRRGEVVSRDDLIETCWEGRVVGDDALNRCISRIRRIGETSSAFRLETIPRVGYRLHVAGHVAPSASGEAPLKAVQRRWLIPAAAALLLAVVAGLAWWINLNSRAVDVQPARLTVAIQEFTAIDSSEESRILAAKIRTAILNRLTKEGVPVVETAAKAKLVIAGNIDQKSGAFTTSLRINHPESGVTLWSTIDEFGSDEISEMPEILAIIIARPTGWATARPQLWLADPNIAQIEQLRLRVVQRGEEEDAIGAMYEARRLRDLAPGDWSPHNLTSFTSMSALSFVPIAERRGILETAREARTKVLELDPGHLALIPQEPPYEFEERLSAFRSRAAIGPIPSMSVAEEYLRTGQSAAAKEEVRKALAPDPSWMGAQHLEARALVAVGERTAASEKLDKAVAVWRKNWGLRELRFEMYLFLTGETEKARAELERKGDGAVNASDETLSRLAKIIRALGANATRVEVETAERECEAPTLRDELLLLRTCLSAMVKLDRLETAFMLVDELYPDILPRAPGEDPDEKWLAARPTAWDPSDLFMPWMASLRTDPRIIPVFERLGLLDYWRQSGNWPDFCETEPQPVCSEMKAGK
jgi:DNA-binding winged helix-turn-helix (wHTH) protein/tetratricopeptide (TPR) repeat protein